MVLCQTCWIKWRILNHQSVVFISKYMLNIAMHCITGRTTIWCFRVVRWFLNFHLYCNTQISIWLGQKSFQSSVSAAVGRFRSRNKVHNPDNITSRIWDVMCDVWSIIIETEFNTYLRIGTFPTRGKRTNILPLSKPGKPKREWSSYQPLCLLDDIWKIMESLLVAWKDTHVQ